jgi:uncharacterized phiE125 gp8 family phage protein
MPSLVVTTPPVVEPVTLAEAKDHLNVTISDDDARIQNYIRTARQKLETRYGIAMITQTLTLGRDYFPNLFGIGFAPTANWWVGSNWSGQYDHEELRYGFLTLRGPVQSITSVTYLDTTGAAQVWASSNYLLDADAMPGRLFLALNKTFPTTAPLPGAVKVAYVSGYTKPELVPDDWKAAVKLLTGEYYQNRENVIVDTRIVALAIPDGVDALMSSYGIPQVR